VYGTNYNKRTQWLKDALFGGGPGIFHRRTGMMTDREPVIAVLGVGYVGLVTGACFAHLGFRVIGYDVDEAKIATLRGGGMPIYEPGLETLLADHRDRLTFTADLDEAIAFADIVFVCVGTPQEADGRADLSQVEGEARAIAGKLDRYRLIVEKSTVPVSTAEWIRKTIRLYAPDSDFDVASNPEFLREGSAVRDFLEPDRIVIGVDSERAAALLRRVYERIDAPLIETSVATAEVIKHASNSFLATKISFINMVADLCEKTGADVREVARGMGYDRRIGPHFLQAGIGYGGSCFPKDVRAFIRIAEDHGVDFSLLAAVDRINQGRIGHLVRRLKDVLWVLKGKTIALWGLSFKPNTDDLREAPSRRLIEALLAEGATIRAHDPQAGDRVAAEWEGDERVRVVADPEEAAAGAHVVLLVTEWRRYLELDPERIREKVATPVVFDGRNALDQQAWQEAGFVFHGVGYRS